MLCIKARILPLNGAHVSLKWSKSCWPLPHVIGSPYLRVLSASLTSDKPSNHPRLFSLSGSSCFLQESVGSPLFLCPPLITCRRYEPRKQFPILAITNRSFLSSPLRDKVDCFTTSGISGLIFLFIFRFRPVTFLSTLRSTCYQAPRKTRYMTAG